MKFIPFLLVILFAVICCNSSKSKAFYYTNTFGYYSFDKKDSIHLYGFTNLDTAIYYAKKEHKNIFLIFKSFHTRLENKMLSLLENEEKIQANYVIVWLEENPKNKAFQLQLIKNNSTPLFCITDTSLNLVKKY